MKDILKRITVNTLNTMGNLLLSPPHGGFGYYRNHGPRMQRKIALTFDDGPSKPSTEVLLDEMAKLDVKGTFFCVGINARMHPDLVARTYAEGHTIGNHSMEHRRWSGMKLHHDGHIDDAANVIGEIIGCRPLLYRPPWGWLTPWEGRRLTQRQYTIVGWDVYTLDWQLPEPDSRSVAEDAHRHTQRGSILLFHDGVAQAATWHKSVTIHAIKQLVPLLRNKGYEFATIPELLGIPAYAPLQPTLVTRGD
jgi:peptidoglycan-N-acetylglucosamine deacetylase